MSNDGKCAGGVEIGVGPCPKCGATEDDVCEVAQTACQKPELAKVIVNASDQIGKLETSLFEMLECYWGKGDGAPAPAFIQKAAKLCGFPLTQ